MRLRGRTSYPRYMTATSNMRTSLPHKALSNTPSHSSSSHRQATKERRVRSSSLQLEENAFSSRPGFLKPQSHHHLVFKPLPLLWSMQPWFLRLFLHPRPPTPTIRMPLLFSSRHPDLQPLLHLRPRITHMLLPTFLVLRAILTLQYIPSSLLTRINRQHL